jgi:prophage maintenance system killer protein
VTTGTESSEKPALHYLTVQDVLWINLQVTKKVQHFNYARLEEGVFYQYGYGRSTGLIPQAARFLTGFAKLRPIAAGNEATAFIGMLAFLKINGYLVKLSDTEAADWISRLGKDGTTPEQALASLVAEDPEFHPTIAPEVREAVSEVMTKYPATTMALAAQDQAREAS